MLTLLCLCALVVPFAVCEPYTPDQLTQMIKVGIGNVERETVNGAVVLEEGSVPTWLNGNFIRHSCGAFGETDHMNSSEPNYIEHLFDCLEIGSKFRLENGQVTFTNKRYDTDAEAIYNFYGRNMNKSSVFISGTFSEANIAQVDMWKNNFSQSAKPDRVPHVSWWQIGNQALAMTETPIGVIVDPNEVIQKGEIQYMDDNFGLPKDGHYELTNNPAHEHTDPDGMLWSTIGVIQFVSQTEAKISRMVYKVGADRVRKQVGTYHYGDVDLTRCHGNSVYPDMGSRFGYLHSFAFTENYIILPEASYMHDPCVYTRYDPHKGFFLQAFVEEQNAFSRLLVMRKSDGVFVASIKTTPFFVTHQFGSYEDNELIHMDMLMYNDSGIYTKHTYLSSIIGDSPYTTHVMRVTINTTDWSYSMRNMRNGPPAAFEMSNINYAYNGKKYTYGYAAKNFDLKARNALTKINMDTGDEIEYLFPEGMFVQEPQFIPTPDAVMEDDGVILAQGVDGRKGKAFMVVVNARTMTLIAHLTAPDLALFGLHERFYPLSVGQSNRIPGIIG